LVSSFWFFRSFQEVSVNKKFHNEYFLNFALFLCVSKLLQFVYFYFYESIGKILLIALFLNQQKFKFLNSIKLI